MTLTPEREQEIRKPWPSGFQRRDIQELGDEIDRLRAELAEAERERDDEIQMRFRWEQDRDVAVEALERIVRETAEHWQDVDDLDDTGAHVGVTRHERAVATGKSFCSSIAREALDRIREE